MRITARVPTSILRDAIRDADCAVQAASDGNVHYWGALPNITLRVHDSDGPGARRAASGRRASGATWEMHRIFLTALFIRVPTARVQTALATYHGVAEFKNAHKATFDSPVGHGTKFGEL